MTALTIHDTERLRELMLDTKARRDEWHRLFHAAEELGVDEVGKQLAAILRAKDFYLDSCATIYHSLAAQFPELLEE